VPATSGIEPRGDRNMPSTTPKTPSTGLATTAQDKQRGRRSSGQALVELAIVLPIFLLLTLAAVDLGRIFFARITVANSAREGAYEAAYGGTYSAGNPCSSSNTVMCAVLNEAQGSLAIAPADVLWECNPSGGCSSGAYGEAVTIKVTGHFELMTPLLAAFFGGTDVTFSSSASADIIDTTSAGIGFATPAPTVLPTSTPLPTAPPIPTVPPIAEPSPTASAPTCSPPVANFTFSAQQKKVDFTSTSTPASGSCAITFWRWEFGDGGTDAGAVPTTIHQYPRNNQSYTVVLTVTNPYGSVSVTRTVTTG
jgi:hypothetical protein